MVVQKNWEGFQNGETIEEGGRRKAGEGESIQEKPSKNTHQLGLEFANLCVERHFVLEMKGGGRHQKEGSVRLAHKAVVP